MKLPEGSKVVTWQEALIAKAEGHAVFVKRRDSAEDLWDYCSFRLPEQFIEPEFLFATKRIPIALDFRATVIVAYVGGQRDHIHIRIPDDTLLPGTKVDVHLTEIIE